METLGHYVGTLLLYCMSATNAFYTALKITLLPWCVGDRDPYTCVEMINALAVFTTALVAIGIITGAAFGIRWAIDVCRSRKARPT